MSTAQRPEIKTIANQEVVHAFGHLNLLNPKATMTPAKALQIAPQQRRILNKQLSIDQMLKATP